MKVHEAENYHYDNRDYYGICDDQEKRPLRLDVDYVSFVPAQDFVSTPSLSRKDK